MRENNNNTPFATLGQEFSKVDNNKPKKKYFKGVEDYDDKSAREYDKYIAREKAAKKFEFKNKDKQSYIMEHFNYIIDVAVAETLYAADPTKSTLGAILYTNASKDAKTIQDLIVSSKDLFALPSVRIALEGRASKIEKKAFKTPTFKECVMQMKSERYIFGIHEKAMLFALNNKYPRISDILEVFSLENFHQANFDYDLLLSKVDTHREKVLHSYQRFEKYIIFNGFKLFVEYDNSLIQRLANEYQDFFNLHEHPAKLKLKKNTLDLFRNYFDVVAVKRGTTMLMEKKGVDYPLTAYNVKNCGKVNVEEIKEFARNNKLFKKGKERVSKTPTVINNITVGGTYTKAKLKPMIQTFYDNHKKFFPNKKAKASDINNFYRTRELTKTIKGKRTKCIFIMSKLETASENVNKSIETETKKALIPAKKYKKALTPEQRQRKIDKIILSCANIGEKRSIRFINNMIEKKLNFDKNVLGDVNIDDINIDDYFKYTFDSYCDIDRSDDDDRNWLNITDKKVFKNNIIMWSSERDALK